MKKNETLEKIKTVLGDNKMTRKELIEASNLTPGQIAGCMYKSQKTNGILKFNNGHFYIEDVINE